MKNSSLFTRTLRALPLFLLLLSACTTQRDVATIVNDSAAASLLAELNPGSAVPQPGAGPSDWKQTSSKIDTFIAAHPDQKTTNAALRVRQAVLLMQCRQPNLAKAAFEQAGLSDLVSERDRALKQLQSELLWWYRTAGETAGIDFSTGEKAQAAITAVLAGLKAPEDEGIHDFLAAVRASVGIKMATDVYGADKARSYLESALNAYAATLPPGETAKWLAQRDWPAAGVTFDTAVAAETRRHFRADGLIVTARKAIAANGIRPAQFKDPYFQQKVGS